MMKKEKEIMLDAISEKVKTLLPLSDKLIEKFIKKMEPMSPLMRNYFKDFYAAKTTEEQQTIKKSYVSKMTNSEIIAFDSEHFDCLKRNLTTHSIQQVS